jgi:hypothetical protein
MLTRYKQVEFKFIAVGDKTDVIIALYNSETTSSK